MWVNNLVDIFYENDYFVFRESAKEYVIDLRKK